MSKPDAYGVIAADGTCLYSSAIADHVYEKAQWQDKGWQASGPFHVAPLFRMLDNKETFDLRLKARAQATALLGLAVEPFATEGQQHPNYNKMYDLARAMQATIEDLCKVKA